MEASSADWREYDRWNDIVADVLFPVRDEPLPAYLDVEEHEIAEIGGRLNIDANSVVDQLVKVVGRTIDKNSYGDGFAQHLKRVRTWRERGRNDTYPAVATLAVFSLAAERMEAGSGMSANNYYGRLSDLLERDKERLKRSYMNAAEPLWAGLNLWLTTLAGLRGTPTAFALGKRFVGLPLSQALVREADRRKLEGFFAEYDFAPRSEVPAAELEPILGAWLTDEQRCKSHLGKLWTKAELRARIAGVASVELQSWNGVDESAEPGTAMRSRALLGLQLQSFPKRRMLVNSYFFMTEPGRARDATLNTPEGDLRFTLVPSPDLQGALVIDDSETIGSAQFLDGVLQLTDDLAGTVVRPPRAVLVFRKDELSGIWLETRQVLMGDDVVVLAATRTSDKVRNLLGEIARPGWAEDTSRAGLPEGWTLFVKVEVFGRPAAATTELNQDFHALVPLTSSQLKLAGGFAIPGASRSRWHVSRAPELRAMHDGGPFTVRILDLATGSSEEHVLDSWSDGGTGSVLINLATQELQVGHYALEMLAGKDVVARKEFTLHSADDHDAAQWLRHDSIAHVLGEPLAALGAGSATDGPCFVQGVVLETDEPPALECTLPPSTPWWAPTRDEVRAPSVTLRRPDPKSCFFTGAHRIELPPAMKDNARESVTGTCAYCGTKKRYSANYYRNRSTFERGQDAAGNETHRRIDVSRLPTIATDAESGTDDWDVALDALRFLGGGPYSSLERVARQLDASSLFVADFVATLESLGHIEVRRSEKTLGPEAWEIAPTAIIDTGELRVFTGFWTASLISEARDSCRAHGYDITVSKYANGLSRYATTATSDELAEWFVVNGEVLLPGRTGKTIAAFLPRLSDLIDALPRVPAATVTDVQLFDPTRAAWVDAVGADAPGAYRVGRYAARYFVRTLDDMNTSTLAHASPYLAKHFAASSLSGRSLIAYERQSRTLVVPLGAQLPGMYERAVVLDSGVPPQKHRGMFVYRDVSEDVVSHITYLLEN